MKKLISVLLAGVLALSLTGCGSGNQSAGSAAPSGAADAAQPGSSEKKLIAFSQGDNGNSWRVTCTDDLKATAEARGYEFVWVDAGADPSKQLSDIQDLLSKKPSILIVDPVQTDALTPCVDMATKANVPLITIDRAVGAKVGTGTYVANIVQDFVEVGRQAGQYTVDYLTKKYGKPQGKVLEISGTVGSSPSIDESNGIREVLSKYPDIKIVASQSGDYARATARTVMDDFLNKYPKGSVDFLISYNDEMSLGAMQAMEDAGRTDLFGAIVSKDGMRDALGEVVKGRIYACVQCTPYFGKTTFDLAEKILKGESYESTVNIPFTDFDMAKNKAATEEYYQKLMKDNLAY